MTTARYTGYVERQMEILQDGRVIASLAVEKFCAIDGALEVCAAQAMARQGECIPVPSGARVPRPKNSRVHGICQ
jgi:hypothetical protein